MLFISEVIDPILKDTFLLNDKFISYGHKDHLQPFPFGGKKPQNLELPCKPVSLGYDSRKWSLLTCGKLQPKPQHFPTSGEDRKKTGSFYCWCLVRTCWKIGQCNLSILGFRNICSFHKRYFKCLQDYVCNPKQFIKIVSFGPNFKTKVAVGDEGRSQSTLGVPVLGAEGLDLRPH